METSVFGVSIHGDNCQKKMREILETDQCVKCASVFDPLSSRMAESIGFKVGILGGSVASLISLGAPDIYLLTLNELSSLTKRVCHASDLPIIVDGDSGYGNSLNVMRTIEELEYAGASIVTLEDTIIPQPYNKPALNLTSIEEACSKLKAALQARKDPNLAIFARTHAEQPLEQLIQRVKSYNQIGVDGICIFGCKSQTRLAEWAKENKLPVLLITYGEVDLGDEAQLTEQNVKIHFAGHTPFEESVKASYQALLKLYGEESPASMALSAKELINRFSENEKYKKIAREYIKVSS